MKVINRNVYRSDTDENDEILSLLKCSKADATS